MSTYEPKPGEPRVGETWRYNAMSNTVRITGYAHTAFGKELVVLYDEDGLIYSRGLSCFLKDCRFIASAHAADDTETNERGGKQSRLPFHPSRFPHAVWLAILAVLEQGAAKYDATPGEQNWRKISAAEHVDHARTHIYLWLDGDRSEPHLIHAICRLAFAAAMHGGD